MKSLVHFKWLVRVGTLVAVLLSQSLSLYPHAVFAQTKINLSESELLFRGLVGETLQRTVTITVEGESLFDVQLIISDLIDPETKAVILSERISVSPPIIDQLSGSQVLTITVTGIEKDGHFEGELNLTYPDQPVDQPLNVKLIVEVNAVPYVDADVNSKSISLFVEPLLLDMPFGRPSILTNSAKVGEVVLSLVQSGDSSAKIVNAKVLALQSAEGRTLPENVIQVESTFPIMLGAKDAATLKLVARGKNLPSGEYNGTLLVNVENQPGPVQIPLRVQVKDGPIIPLVLLAIGPLVGILLMYWNKDGKVLLDARQQIKRLQRTLKTARNLTVQDQLQAELKLETIIDAILNKVASGDIANQLNDLAAFIKGQQEIGDQYILSLQSLIEQNESLPIGQTIKENTSRELQKLMQNITSGSSPSWETIQNGIDHYQSQVDEMKQVISEYEALNEDHRLAVLPRMENATSMAEFRNAVEAGRDIIPKKIKEFFIPDDETTKPEWERFTLSLQWRRVAVAVIVYLFTLFVGWITLYTSAPTFGASREDYITLFLWGVASNVVGGQTVDLKSILTRSNESLTDI